MGMLNSPSGLILVTGPTGSGKTTTLYACLPYLNNGERKINTIEDPDRVRHRGHPPVADQPRSMSASRSCCGVSAAGADIIMIGEIRDAVTAETAVRAANSGHLVLATLHAPIAAGAIQSMLSLGVHPHFLSSSLLGVIAQRLVRTLCPHCKRPSTWAMPRRRSRRSSNGWNRGEGKRFYGRRAARAAAGRLCRRTGIFEVLPVTTPIRSLIQETPAHGAPPSARKPWKRG